MRAYMRSKTVDNIVNTEVLKETGLTPEETEKMYELMAIANYNDRFVIPTSHKEYADDVFDNKTSGGYPKTYGTESEIFKNLFGGI